MTGRAVQRYFRLNLALCIVGGLMLALAARHGCTPCLADPLAGIAWPGGHAAPDPAEVPYWRQQAQLAASHAAQLQGELYLLASELRNREAAEGVLLDAPEQIVVARVVRWRDLSDLRRAVLIDRGTDAGLAEGLAVTCNGWLVGVTTRVAEHCAWVLLLEDTAFRCEVVVGGPMAEAHLPSGPVEVGRPRGLYVGLGGLGGTGEIRHIPVTGRQVAGPEVQVGAVVYTSPDGEVPAGLPMGLIRSIQGQNNGLFLELRMRPFVSLQDMETVAVLLPGREGRRWLPARARARSRSGELPR